jgi:uncharacterized membrane protein
VTDLLPLHVGLRAIYDKARTLASLPLVIAIVALVLRLVTLDRKSLWLDEVVTLQYAMRSVEHITLVRSDPHPPLYYLLMHYWIALGSSEFILRLPSALAGVAAIPMLYWLLRVWGGAWSAMTSAWLLAIAPLHVWYAQEARMYALVCTLGLASTLCYSLGVRYASKAAWVGWVVATVAGLYTDYSVLLVVLAQVVVFGPLWQGNGSQRKTLLLALLAVSIVALLFAPQARTFVAGLVVQGGSVWYYLSLQSLLEKWGMSISTAQLHTAVLLTSVATVGVVAVVVWVMPRRVWQIRLGIAPISVVVILYVLILLASAIPRGLGAKRQTLVLFPYLLGIVAMAVSTHRRRDRLIAGLALVTLPVSGYIAMMQVQEDWRNAVRLVEQKANQRDAILISASYVQWPFDYYYRGQLPRQGVDPASVPKALSDTAASHERAWLVLSNDSLTDPQGTVPAWFDSHMRLIQAWSYPGIRIRLYERGAQ